MALFSRSTPESPSDRFLSRIAESLDQLARLYSLDLASRGLVTATSELEGEILETSEESLATLEREEERKTHFGLAPDREYAPLDPAGNPWPATAAGGSPLFGASWAFPVGPEGAENPEPNPQEAGRG